MIGQTDDFLRLTCGVVRRIGEEHQGNEGGGDEAGDGGGSGEGAMAHLHVGNFNAMDLCNCLSGISLFRMRDTQVTAPRLSKPTCLHCPFPPISRAPYLPTSPYLRLRRHLSVSFKSLAKDL